MEFPVEVRDRFVDLVCDGRPLRSAAVEVGVSPAQAVVWWRQCGRMELEFAAGSGGGLDRPNPPECPGRGRVRRALTSEDRAVIQAGDRTNMTQVEIAALIGRDKSVVCREIKRNRSPDGEYRAVVAHRAAAVGRERPKSFKLVDNPGLFRRIEAWMDDGWSPRLISQVLAAESTQETDRVSHETIYQALYVQTRGSLRADLHRQLSLKRAARKARVTADGRGKSLYREAFTISQRPPEVEDRAVPGHWEGDLVRHEALCDRAEVRDRRRCAVAAA